MPVLRPEESERGMRTMCGLATAPATGLEPRPSGPLGFWGTLSALRAGQYSAAVSAAPLPVYTIGTAGLLMRCALWRLRLTVGDQAK